MYWNRHQRRVYKRCRQGMASHDGERCSFLTLTSPNKESQNNPLEKSLNLLIKRIRHRFGNIEYYAVRTNEGNGVYHLLFFGPYIPQKWISEQWTQLRGAWSVDIREVGDIMCKRRVSKYIIRQYLADQVALVRATMSRGWLRVPAYRIKQVTKKLRQQVKIKPWQNDSELYEIIDDWLSGWLVYREEKTCQTLLFG